MTCSIGPTALIVRFSDWRSHDPPLQTPLPLALPRPRVPVRGGDTDAPWAGGGVVDLGCRGDSRNGGGRDGVVVIHLFNKQWDAVPLVVVDVETTGTLPGIDAAVQVALVRFEGGEPVARFSSLLNPGRDIPIAAIGIHGITDMAVKDAPRIADVFAMPDVLELLKDSQPVAYNATF